MREQLLLIKNAALEQLNAAESLAALEELRIKFLGKKGELTGILRQMGSLSEEERPVIGAVANEVRAQIELILSDRFEILQQAEMSSRLANEKIDVTMPGKPHVIGRRHPLTKTLDEITDIFAGMGFEIAEGPEVETDYYNFEALNTPKNHPARDLQDTFYFSEHVLLRTQTSSVQIRHLEKQKPPLRMICPGAVYRSDDVDATHSPLFHQIEGLVVDKGINFGHLKGTLNEFARRFYGSDTKTRFRPHYFPFTEPSAEMDVSCFACKGSGCRLCKGEGFIEVLGAGMVHPYVLRYCGVDPDEYSGFAFGMGHERLTMLKYKIDDLRLFFENDIRFIKQF